MRILSFAISLYVFGASSVAIMAQDSENQSGARLSLSVTPHKTEVLVGEPVIIRLTIRNDGTGTQEMHTFRPQVGMIQISSDGKVYRDYDDGWGAYLHTVPQKLAPGGSISSDFIVLGTFLYEVKQNPRQGTATPQLAWSQAAPVHLRGCYHVGAESDICGSSTVVRIQIPQGDDAAVWADLQGLKEYIELAHYPARPVQQDVADTFGDIVRKHPTSTYSHYLALFLGKYYRSQYWAAANRPGISSIVKEPVSTALKYFEAAANMTQVPVIQEEAFVHWAELVDDEQTRLGICERALKLFPVGWYTSQLQTRRTYAAEVIAARANDPK